MGTLPATATAAGIRTTIGTDITSTLGVGTNGTLTVTLTGDASLGDAGGESILLTLISSSGGQLEYQCKAGATMPVKFLPANCRG